MNSTYPLKDDGIEEEEGDVFPRNQAPEELGHLLEQLQPQDALARPAHHDRGEAPEVGGAAGAGGGVHLAGGRFDSTGYGGERGNEVWRLDSTDRPAACRTFKKVT